jgi:hypothetical protein
MAYVYRPVDNRTPVNHPVLGHLEWGTVIDDPSCAGDPNFEEIKPKKAPARKKAPAKPEPAKEPAVADKPATPPAANQTPANSTASAGKPGRSN